MYFNKINAGDVWSTKMNTKLKRLKSMIKELRPSLKVMVRKYYHIYNTKRCICIDCREPVYINQICNTGLDLRLF